MRMKIDIFVIGLCLVVIGVFCSNAGFVGAFDEEVKGTPWQNTTYTMKVVMQLGDLYKFSFENTGYNLIEYSSSSDSAGLMISPGTWKKIVYVNTIEKIDLDKDGKDDISINVSSIVKDNATILFTQLALVPAAPPVIEQPPLPPASNVSLNESLENNVSGEQPETMNRNVSGNLTSGEPGSAKSFFSTTNIIIGVVVLVVILVIVYYAFLRRPKVRVHHVSSH